MNHLSISEVRADALFVSSLQRSDQPSTGQIRRAVAAAVREFGGPGCIGLVAQEFGEHPDLAAARMRWALRLTAGAFGGPGSPGPASTGPASTGPASTGPASTGPASTGPAGNTVCCQPHAA